MILDKVFMEELDGYLKKQKINKKERNKIIERELCLTPTEMLDSVLEKYRSKIPKKEQIPSEDTEQINFVEWFRKTHPNVVIMAIWNGGTRSPGERAKQIAMGLHPGAADLFVPVLGLWIEMKRTKGWVWKDEQKEFSKYCNSIGHEYILGVGFEGAKYQVSEFINRKRKNN